MTPDAVTEKGAVPMTGVFEVGRDSKPVQVRWCERCGRHHTGERVGNVTVFACPSLPEDVMLWCNPQERSLPDIYLPLNGIGARG